MSLKVVPLGFASKAVSGVTTFDQIIAPRLAVNFAGSGSYNVARITVMGSQGGDGSLIGYFKVDSTDPEDTPGGGEPVFDGQSFMTNTQAETRYFKFIQAASYAGAEADTYISLQAYIDNNQPE